MPSVEPKKTELYLGKCLGDLNKLSEVQQLGNNVNIIVRSSAKVFQDAVRNDGLGDEEKSYVLYIKYFNILKQIKTKADYKKNKEFFDNLIGKKNQIQAINRAEHLSASLKERYDLKEAETVAKKLLPVTVQNVVPPKDQSNDAKVEEETVDSKKKETEIEKAVQQIGSISCGDLCNLLRDQSTKVILMDVRKAEDFAQSHISHTDCISVPENICTPGSTVSHIQAKLPPDSLALWQQRKNVDFIILIDWSSTFESLTVGSPLRTLKDALFKFDMSTVIKSEPLVLEGGYEKWLLFYPTMTTNAHVSKPSDSTAEKPPSPTMTLDFDYPDLDENLEKIPVPGTNVNLLNSDMMSKVPNSPSPTSSSASLPRIDRSLKPSFGLSSSISSEDETKVLNNDPNKFVNAPVSSMYPSFDSGLKNTNITNSQQTVKTTNLPSNNQQIPGGITEPKGITLSVRNDLATDLSQSTASREQREAELKDFQSASTRQLAEDQQRVDEAERKLRSLELLKKKEEKDVADLMRMKRKLAAEVDAEKQNKIEDQNRLALEEQRRMLALEKARREEAEKKARLQEVERLRQERKKAESDKRWMEEDEEEERQWAATQEALKRKQEEEQMEQTRLLQDEAIVTGEEERKRAAEKSEEERRILMEKELAEKDEQLKEAERQRQEALRQAEEMERKLKEEKEMAAKLETERKRKEEAEAMERKRKEAEAAEKERRENLEREEKRKQQEAQKRAEQQALAIKAQKERDEAERQRKQQETASAPSKNVPSNMLPSGWEKRLDRTTNRYFYIDHNRGITQWTPPITPGSSRPEGTYTTQLKDEPSVSSSRGLSRSHSSPNIKKMMEEEEERERRIVPLPSVNRDSKPVIRPQNLAAKHTPHSLRKRDLNPVYGNVGPALTGLRNLGNTCYMNSTIQCLNNTSPLVSYILNDAYIYDVNRESSQGMFGEVVDDFAVVVKALWSQQYRSITPRDLKAVVGKYNPMFAGYQQQDSQEFLTFLLDGLHEGLNEVKKAPEIPEQNNDGVPDSKAAQIAWNHHKMLHKSIIVELFQGQLKSTLMCLTCRKTSVTFQAFMFLSLPIPSSSRCSLRDCIQAFLKPEMMTGSSKWKCPRCKVERDSQKKIDIWKLPPILLVGLNRFYSEGMWMQKKSTYVDFPLDALDLSPYIIGPPPRNSYNLYGISNHYGTMEGGHYTAYCRNPVSKSWSKFDDQDVYDISKSDVKTSAAFVLYYTSIEMQAPKYVPRL